MDRAGRSVRARSFGAIAETYDRFRPAPPASAVEWVLREPCGTALDLGAGTGALSRRLTQRAERVIAVEPDPRMLEVLCRRSPGVLAVCALAERLPVAGASADAVAVSSAWHWMDGDLTLAEIARVLRPGGVLGIVWNGVDRSVDWVGSLLGRPDPPSGDRAAPRERHRFVLPADAPFDDLDTTTTTWTLALTGEELVGLAETYSSMITLPASRRGAEVERIRERVAELAAPHPDGTFDVPMGCRCWRAVRR
ncbi:MAG: class I SAM-dependent methyltransferase [Acidimicrobiales bacterium]